MIMGKFGSLFIQTELFVEAANTAAGVYHLLLTGEKGVTLGADLHADIRFGGARLDHVAAGTPNGGLSVLGMDVVLHLCSPLSLLKQSYAKACI